ncbi:glycerate kinase type-2 family protein [Dinoroseobacter sp. S375]|uniref:glycerate kinase type-2 family protein n=1 Tax=Dinoroseobacter sp. S375 TaxID=3415136 RepID=UPI003C7B409D
MTPNAEAFLNSLFRAAVAAADPAVAVPKFLPEKPTGRVVVVGAGKASAKMAQAVEAVWGPCEGIVIVPYGAALPTEGIEIVEARHPVPDASGQAAAARILDLVSGLGEGDLALCLISGGGSALLAAPGEGLTLEDKQAVNKALLSCGAAIDEMNCLRKHLSRIKGGRLTVAAWPARCVTLTISDVPGDDPAIIASGPTVPDPTTASDAREIAARYHLDLSDAVAAYLQTPAAETPDPTHPAFAAAECHMIATPQMALDAAAEVARAEGVAPLILGDALEGEAAELGIVLAGVARAALTHGHPIKGPAVILSGGETTVTVRGSYGKGGRNSECLLSFGLHAPEEVSALSCDTDGIDGSEDNAGVIWVPRVAAHKAEARPYLEGHDAYSFFEKAGGLVVSGPTHTNVNDFRAIYIPG